MSEQSAQVEVFRVEPLSEDEIDLVSSIALASTLISTIALLILLVLMILVVVKTNLPGRYFTLISAITLILFRVYVFYMGGKLEYVFGPIGNLYEVIVYSLVITLFSIGFGRMCWHFKNAEK